MQCCALRGKRISPCAFGLVEMTEVFGRSCTHLVAERIEKHVISTERSEWRNPFSRRLQNAIARRAICSLNWNLTHNHCRGRRPRRPANICIANIGISIGNYYLLPYGNVILLAILPPSPSGPPPSQVRGASGASRAPPPTVRITNRALNPDMKIKNYL